MPVIISRSIYQTGKFNMKFVFLKIRVSMRHVLHLLFLHIRLAPKYTFFFVFTFNT